MLKIACVLLLSLFAVSLVSSAPTTCDAYQYTCLGLGSLCNNTVGQGVCLGANVTRDVLCCPYGLNCTQVKAGDPTTCQLPPPSPPADKVTLKIGDFCNTTADCVAPLRCNASSDYPYAATVCLGSLFNQTCTNDIDCGYGLYCEKSTVCLALLKIADGCNATSHLPIDTYCNSKGVVTQYLSGAVGTGCDPTVEKNNHVCAPGLTCFNNACASLSTLGVPCNLNGSVGCDLAQTTECTCSTMNSAVSVCTMIPNTPNITSYIPSCDSYLIDLANCMRAHLCIYPSDNLLLNPVMIPGTCMANYCSDILEKQAECICKTNLGAAAPVCNWYGPCTHDTPAKPSNKMAGWKIALIVIGSIAGVIIIVGAIAFFMKKRKQAKYNEF